MYLPTPIALTAMPPQGDMGLKAAQPMRHRSMKEVGTGMNTPQRIGDSLREEIISRPDMILDDPDLMNALIAANEQSMGGNIVDLRGIAMERLENRLDRLEDTHRSVIAAAYENLAGTNQIHRALLALLDPLEFEDFLANLGTSVAEILKVDCIRLVIESHDTEGGMALASFGDLLQVAPSGYIDEYLADQRGSSLRQVTLRQIALGDGQIYGEIAPDMRSEACLKLDFGPGRLPGLLVMGSEDPHLFSAQQGTDLLAFFASVFERTMRRWLG